MDNQHVQITYSSLSMRFPEQALISVTGFIVAKGIVVTVSLACIGTKHLGAFRHLLSDLGSGLSYPKNSLHTSNESVLDGFLLLKSRLVSDITTAT